MATTQSDLEKEAVNAAAVPMEAQDAAKALSDPEDFRRAFKSAKQIGIVAGSGLSAASGIPTFRGAGGLWTKYNLNTLEQFDKDPSVTWLFYNHLRETYRSARPNAAHYALALLNNPEVLSRVAPSVTKPPLLITQNIDGISLRILDSCPGVDPAVAKENLIQMHGELYRTICLACRHSHFNDASPLCKALEGTEELLKREVEELPKIPVEQLPKCGGDEWKGSNRYGRCGGLLRPGVVWFGEVPYVGEISRYLAHCDLLLVVGTSSLVHPAAGFAAQVKRQGGKVAVFNSERSKGDEEADFLLLGPCEEVLPGMLGMKEDVEKIMTSS